MWGTVLKSGVVYFLLVFGAGFVLGPVRVLLVEPRVGARMAELLEAPVMLAVIVVAARWVVGRFCASSGKPVRFGVGALALSLLLLAEFTVVLSLRGMSLGEYFQSRDPVSGAVYLASLVVFAVMPILIKPRRSP